MLATLTNGIFAVPENPVMRAVIGAPVMPTAGATTQPLAKNGLGCSCGIKPFGLGLAAINEEGLRMAGDWYGGSPMRGYINGDQHIPVGMRLNNDMAWPGLGSYWGVPGVNYPGGLGDLETFFGNLTSGNWSQALMGTDISSSFPNVVVVLGAWWFIATIMGQGRRVRKSAGEFARRQTR